MELTTEVVKLAAALLGLATAVVGFVSKMQGDGRRHKRKKDRK